MRLGIAMHSMGLPQDDLLGALKRCRQLGLMALNCGSKPLQDRRYLQEVKSYIEETGIELIVGFGDRYIDHADKQPTDAFRKFIEDICIPLNITRIPTASTHHRWHKNPPLEEQLQRMAAAFRPLCETAVAYGVRLAIENHADYRGKDLARLIAMVDHPALRIQLDTGNAFVVAEDPVDAALALAPFTISTHIKDMTVRPMSEGEWIKVKGCGIGEGDVDFHQVVAILLSQCPEVDDLPYTLEIEPPPGCDLARLTEEAIAYTLKEFSGSIRAYTPADSDELEGSLHENRHSGVE